MADSPITFASISTDAVSYWIASEMIALAEKRLVVGQFAQKFQLPQRLGKTLRVDKFERFNLPTTTLTEGTPPDAISLTVTNVDVSVEQWGIVALLTDVAQITTHHPALAIAIDRVSMAMEETVEREQMTVLMAGTQVVYPGVITSRASLLSTSIATTATVLKATTTLRSNGAQTWDGSLYGGVMSPQMESDLLGTDTTFQNACNFANVRALQVAEIAIWMGVRWSRGNFLPILKGQLAPTATAASGTLTLGTEKPLVTAVDGGGTIVSATNFKFAVVFRDKTTDREVHITQTSADIASAATGNNESFTIGVTAGTLTNYTYDVYMTVAGGAGSLFKVLSRQATATSAAITAAPAGTEAVLPAAPAANVVVTVAFVFGKGAFGRVELNGMSLASYLTPDGPSYANPLNQGRKCGSKIMFKAFILENLYFVRIETGTAQPNSILAG